MGYEEVTDWIFGLKRFGIKLGLRNIKHLLELVGNPEKSFKSILVGGTNGKGSSVAMIASVLKEAGYKVGAFTKPHLSSYTERIVVNGEKISEDDVVRLVNEIKPAIDAMSKDPKYQHPTFFEVTTAIALKYFAEQKIDFAVLEVGMGGRLDATNAVDSLVSVITNVSLEHMEILGKTVLKIAKEKAGIIKKNGILITATDDNNVFNLFKKLCGRKCSKMFRVGRDIKFKKITSDLSGQMFQLNGLFTNFDELHIPLLGDYQLTNAATAIGAIEALKYHDIIIPKKAINNGLKNVRWPGRLEIMQKNPLVVLDCAKDAVATEKLKEAVLNNFKYKKLTLVVSISSDKDMRSMVKQLASIVDLVIITEHKVMGRAAKPTMIADEVNTYAKPYTIIEDVKGAVRKAVESSDKKDMVLITGSLFTVGEARELWYKEVDLKWGRELNEAP